MQIEMEPVSRSNPRQMDGTCSLMGEVRQADKLLLPTRPTLLDTDQQRCESFDSRYVQNNIDRLPDLHRMAMDLYVQVCMRSLYRASEADLHCINSSKKPLIEVMSLGSSLSVD